MLLLDCRAERKKNQVCSPFQYEKVFKAIAALPSHVEHLVIQVGVPIFYPRVGLESFCIAHVWLSLAVLRWFSWKLPSSLNCEPFFPFRAVPQLMI